MKRAYPEERKTYYRRTSAILQAVVVELLREERIKVGTSEKFFLKKHSSSQEVFFLHITL